MAWADGISTEQFLKLRDEFNIKTFIETGTFKGVNAKFYSQYWDEVITCEIDEKYFRISEVRLSGCSNVTLLNQSSSYCLRDFCKSYKKQKRTDTVFFYLDAHFYDPSFQKKINGLFSMS